MSRKLKPRKKKNHISEAAKAKDFHAFVAAPAYDGKCDIGFTNSICQAAFTAPLFGCKITMSLIPGGAFIDLSRNQLVQAFLKSEATHLFFIDTDLEFGPEAFIGLLRCDLPIVCGVYPKRQEKEEYPVLWMDEPKHGGMWVDDNGFIMAKRIPTGFLCIRRDVIEEMATDAIKLTITGWLGEVPVIFEAGVHEKEDGSHTFIGEDFLFSDKYVKKYDKPIPVWADVDFTHGGHKGNLAEYLQRTIYGEKTDDVSAA